MKSLEDQLTALGEHLEERHGPISSDEVFRARSTIDPVTSPLPRWRVAVAAAVVLIGITAAAVTLFRAGEEDSSRVITEPEQSETPDTSEPPSTSATVARADTDVVVGEWAPIEALPTLSWGALPGTPSVQVDSASRYRSPIVSDGSGFVAAAGSGEVLRSQNGETWQSITTTRFPFPSGAEETPYAFLAAAHDSTVLVIETDDAGALTVHVVDPGGEVTTTSLAMQPDASPSAAIGPGGMLVSAADELFFSETGVAWERVEGTPRPAGSSGFVTVVATDSGFVGLDSGVALHSPDGRSWRPLEIFDGVGLARFDSVSPFRGGAALWSDASGDIGAGIGFVNGDGSGTTFAPPPDLGAGLVLAPTDWTGGAGIGGLVVPWPRFSHGGIVIGDGENWSRLAMPPAVGEDFPAGLAIGEQAMVVVADDGTAWLGSLADVVTSSRDFPSTGVSGPAVAAAEEIGRRFVHARDARDTDATVALFADGAVIFDGGGTNAVTEPSQVTLMYEFFDAVGWQFLDEGCVGAETRTDAVVVGCRYREGNAWSRVMTGSAVAGEADWLVETEVVDGLIVGTRTSPRLSGATAAGWAAFRVFVEDSHPDDVSSMYASLTWPVLSPASIELWSTYTTEFVDRGLVDELTDGTHIARFEDLMAREGLDWSTLNQENS